MNTVITVDSYALEAAEATVDPAVFESVTRSLASGAVDETNAAVIATALRLNHLVADAMEMGTSVAALAREAKKELGMRDGRLIALLASVTSDDPIARATVNRENHERVATALSWVERAMTARRIPAVEAMYAADAKRYGKSPYAQAVAVGVTNDRLLGALRQVGSGERAIDARNVEIVERALRLVAGLARASRRR